MFSDFENRAVYGTMSKNVVKPDGTQMMLQYGAYAMHDG
jgi:hypothetical protein